MKARDANNATWFTLRYAEDFNPRSSAQDAVLGPRLEPSLHFDVSRSGLALRPESKSIETQPLRGLALDIDENLYVSDRATSMVRVRRCDGSEQPLLCDQHAFQAPAGLAINKQGLLFVADRQAQRIIVIEPESGSIQNIFGGGKLVEPVDVAVTGTGIVYVADRATGSVVVFDSQHRHLLDLIPRNPEGSPREPKPIAITLDNQHNLIVVDAIYPRLLRFDRDLSPLADIELSSHLFQTIQHNQLEFDYYARLIGQPLPRTLIRIHADARPVNKRNLMQRLAESHQMLRLLSMRLEQSYPSRGVFISAILDSGQPGSTWHRVEVDADLPEEARLFIETATADDPEKLTPEQLEVAEPNVLDGWQAPRRLGRLIPFTPRVMNQLVQSPPGRYMRLRVTLESDGLHSPHVSAIRIRYPRVSYLDLLPPLFRRDPDSARFLERFLALFEGVLTGIEDRYEEFSRQLNPDAVPRELVDWLACLVDLSFDPSWPLDKRRALLVESMELYRTRGTVQGLERFVEIYTGRRPVVRELFLERPSRPAYLGTPGSVLGCSLALRPTWSNLAPEPAAFHNYAHRFLMLVYLDDVCDAELVLPVVQRIVAVNKPAHTLFSLQVVQANARVSLQSTVGTDFVIGQCAEYKTVISGCAVPSGPHIQASVLGFDSIIGQRRPQYVRPISQGLR